MTEVRSDPLKGCAVLVTRPGKRGCELVEQLNALGAMAAIAEVMEIELLSGASVMRKAVSELSLSSTIVFVSVHAVNAFAEAASRFKHTLPESAGVAAIGFATAAALKDLGIQVDLAPVDKMNSEGLLTMFENIELRGQRITIFRGQSGRELLATTFRQRGAQVVEVESYRRHHKPVDLTRELNVLAASDRRAVILTSVDLIDAFLGAVTSAQRHTAFNSDLVVLSQRIADAGRKAGFAARIVIAPTTNNAGLVQGIKSLYAKDPSS